MMNKDFTTTIEIQKSPGEVFKSITKVASWWNKDDFAGNSSEPGDEFTIDHPGLHYSKQKLVEVIPGKRIVWLVTESMLQWLKNDKKEWTDTRMIFDIEVDGSKTILHFTHEGLSPEKECYVMCEMGWLLIIKDWLFHFITFGKPSPEMAKAAEIRNSMLNK